MAARNRIGISEQTRTRIQTSMLVNRLEEHIVGKIELSNTQIKAIDILLRKTIPDLQSLDVRGLVQHDHDHTLTIRQAIDFETIQGKRAELRRVK